MIGRAVAICPSLWRMKMALSIKTCGVLENDLPTGVEFEIVRFAFLEDTIDIRK